MDYRVPDKTLEHTLLQVLFAPVLSASPVMFAWAQDDSPWFIPYLLWAALIAVSAAVSVRRTDV